MSYIKDLEIGKVYTMLYGSKKDKYIVKYNGTADVYTIWHENSFKTFDFTASYNWKSSTFKDTIWLEACIKAGKYVEIPKSLTPKYIIYDS